MRPLSRDFVILSTFVSIAISLCCIFATAQEAAFRNAPPASATAKNPNGEGAAAVAAGKKAYARNCAQCHGNRRQGMGPAPALDSERIRKAQPGALFWFISNGKPSSGMPSWQTLPKQQRWDIVSFLQSPSAK